MLSLSLAMTIIRAPCYYLCRALHLTITIHRSHFHKTYFAQILVQTDRMSQWTTILYNLGMLIFYNYVYLVNCDILATIGTVITLLMSSKQEVLASSIHVLFNVSGCRRIWAVHSWWHFVRSKRWGQSGKPWDRDTCKLTPGSTGDLAFLALRTDLTPPLCLL